MLSWLLYTGCQGITWLSEESFCTCMQRHCCCCRWYQDYQSSNAGHIPNPTKTPRFYKKNNCPYSIKYLQITKRFAGSTEWATVRFWRMRWIEAPAPVIWGAPWGTTSTPCCVNFAHFQISLSWFNCVFSGISVQSPNTCNSFDFL